MFFSSKRIQENYRRNSAADLSGVTGPEGTLNGQGREGLRQLAFGRARVGKAGCGSIAVYNALLLLQRPRPLAEVIRAMERGGYLRFGGHWGSAPFFQPLLRRWGASARVAPAAGLQRQADAGTLAPGSVFLISIFNNRWELWRGLHSFAVRYEPDPRGDWAVYNRFNEDAVPRRYRRLRDILKNGAQTGAFLVIYRLRTR